MNRDLTNKNVIITGASSGIGRDIALKSAMQGATVILMARRKKALEAVATKISQMTKAKAYVFPTDLSDVNEIESSFNKINNQFKRIDVLINCAGFGTFKSFMDTDVNSMENMLKVNVLGLMYFTRLVGSKMMEVRNGQIINFGSLLGRVPVLNSAVYNATKAAVIQFSNTLRLELKPYNVHVMTVNPGPVSTPFFDTADKKGNFTTNIQKFMIDADQIAQGVVDNIGSKKRELNLPRSLAIAAKLYNLFPNIGDWITVKLTSI